MANQITHTAEDCTFGDKTLMDSAWSKELLARFDAAISQCETKAEIDAMYDDLYDLAFLPNDAEELAHERSAGAIEGVYVQDPFRTLSCDEYNRHRNEFYAAMEANNG